MHHHLKSENRMFLSFVLNFVFTVFEFFGGLLTGSIALMSDALHDLGDSISIGIAIFLEKKSKQKADYKYTYGYYRFSLLGGMISSVILIVGSTIIIYRSIERLIHPEPLLNSQLLIIFAFFGVIVNGAAAYNASKGSTINEKVISLHLLEDVFGWIALLITSIFIHLFQIDILDAILSLLFSLYIIYHVFRTLKSIFEVFLEKAPKEPMINDIRSALLNQNDIIDVHHIHLWSLEGSISIITLHVVIEGEKNALQINDIQTNIHQTLHKIGISHATVQIEFENLECIGDKCDDISINHHH